LKVTIFSSNQPRHIRLVNRLADLGAEVSFVCEANTVYPGKTQDFFSNSPVMCEYFENVIRAEKSLFGDPTFTNSGIKVMTLKSGDLSQLSRNELQSCLEADRYIVFGASYIRGWLVEELVSRGAINIHMGLSPFYRGSSCNFWAMFDNNPAYVGATLHLLTRGLDSGPILKQLSPVYEGEDSFTFTMKAVLTAQDYLLEALSSGTLDQLIPTPQRRESQIRYTKNSDFTDEIAESYLRRNVSPEEIKDLIQRNPAGNLI
jgi:folate-dependent phosphoribosylglycinamide formyltransferase PurN